MNKFYGSLETKSLIDCKINDEFISYIEYDNDGLTWYVLYLKNF